MGVKYSLIVWKCASHVINLCVVAAICGTVFGRPSRTWRCLRSMFSIFPLLGATTISRNIMQPCVHTSSTSCVLSGHLQTRLLSQRAGRWPWNCRGYILQLYFQMNSCIFSTDLWGGWSTFAGARNRMMFKRRCIPHSFEIFFLYWREASSDSFLALLQLRALSFSACGYVACRLTFWDSVKSAQTKRIRKGCPDSCLSTALLQQTSVCVRRPCVYSSQIWPWTWSRRRALKMGSRLA